MKIIQYKPQELLIVELISPLGQQHMLTYESDVCDEMYDIFTYTIDNYLEDK